MGWVRLLKMVGFQMGLATVTNSIGSQVEQILAGWKGMKFWQRKALSGNRVT